MHLLLVEDDERLAALTARLLRNEHHVVDVTGRGQVAIEMAEADGIDAVILDVGLPDISGLEVARRLRADGLRVPILMLTARDSVRDRVGGLDAGADDYLVKPFAHEELAARLRALRRRSEPEVEGLRSGSALVCGPIALDEVTRRVSVAGRPIDLSLREFATLECLLRHANQILSRDQILDLAWPYGVEVMAGSVDAYVYLLRRKLGPEAGGLIEAVRGIGYRLVRE
jgi:two-component system OmpR family response regulator